MLFFVASQQSTGRISIFKIEPPRRVGKPRRRTKSIEELEREQLTALVSCIWNPKHTARTFLDRFRLHCLSLHDHKPGSPTYD